MSKIIQFLKRFDWILFLPVFLLMIFGLAEIYSVSLGSGQAMSENFYRQILFVSIGLVLLFVVAASDYLTYRGFAYYFYFFGFLALLGVLFFGETIRGTKGWYNLGFVNLQPVEFAKLLLILFLARFFSSRPLRTSPMKYLAISAFATTVYAFLVLKQPDFGSAMMLVTIWASMVFFAGFSKRYLLLIVLSGILAFGGAWLFLFKDYQKERIMTFLNPNQDSFDQGYNVAQAVIAVGSGGLYGRGIGFGSQSQLKFLPEAQNDFLFAVIAEELGFMGVCMVLLLFFAFFLRLLYLAKKADNDFAAFYLLGLATLIFIQMFINIGMNLGILPVVGLSLPFMSYGGSAIVSFLCMIGIAESVAIRVRTKY